MSFSSKVHPESPFKLNYFLGIINILLNPLRSAANYWFHVQIGHRGRYSVERLLSFRDYYQRTSSSRVMIVCILALVPAFIVAILVECIPLKSPEEGWRANYAFWIRLFVSSLPIAFGAVYQVVEVIDADVISPAGIIITGVGSCSCYVALSVGIAAVWKFPIPFGYVLTIAPFVLFYIMFFLLSIGPGLLAKSPRLRRQIMAQMMIVAAQGVLAIAYPTFSAIFNQLSGYQQTVFMFVLPAIKFTIKQFIARISAHLQECVGPIVVLSVDVCNVLYVLNCMQTATSPLTTTLMIVFDAIFVALALRSIYYQSEFGDARREISSSSSSQLLEKNYLQHVMELVQESLRDLGGSDVRVLIRVRAPFTLPLSNESAALLSSLMRWTRKNATELRMSRYPFQSRSSVSGWMSNSGSMIQNRSKRNSIDALLLSDHRKESIVPDYRRITPAKGTFESKFNGPPLVLPNQQQRHMSSVTISIISVDRVSSAPLISSHHHRSDTLQEAQDALQALFHSEYVVLGEFIEFAIPVLYAVYLACLYHLPTAAYYPHTRSLTPEKFARAELSLMVYALVELSSFVGLIVLLKRKFGFSPLYQLAFVIETQVRTFQGHVFLWIMVILQITLMHNGVDLEAPFK